MSFNSFEVQQNIKYVPALLLTKESSMSNTIGKD
jgi:hypothetical protein